MNYGHLNNSFNLFDYLFDLDDWDFFDYLNCSYSFLYNNFLYNNLDLSNFCDDMLNFYYFFNNLWDLYDSFDSLDNRNWFFNDSFYDFMSHFNVILNFSGWPVLNLWDDFLFNFDNFNNLRNMNNFLYNFLYDNWHLDNPLYYFFEWWNDNFLNNLNLFNYFLNMVHNSFHLNNFFYLYDFFDYSFNLDNFWNLSYYLNDSFNDLRDFNDSFHNLLNWNNLLDNVCNDWRNLKWDINVSLDLSNFLDLDDLLDDLLNHSDCWNLNDSVDDFLDNLLNFNYLRNNSKYFQNVINIYDSHNFLINHSDNTLVNLKDNACSSLNFLELLKKRFNQDSQVELNFSSFFAWISINVLDFYNLRNVFNNLYQSINFIYFDDID